MVVSCQSHAAAALPQEKRPGNYCTRGWVGPRAGLEGCRKSAHNGSRSPDRLVRSESLYRLHYPGPHTTTTTTTTTTAVILIAITKIDVMVIITTSWA
jgi:hypothetical protein